MIKISLHLASIFPLFVPAVRDYIDILNNAYDSVLSDISVQQIVWQFAIFFWNGLLFTFSYFFSFQWVKDLTYLPVLVPQLKMEILKEHFFLQTPHSNFFTFLETPSYIHNKFLLGFLNSLFLCLPLSIAHIISTRRLLIQGFLAGVFSSLGTMCGQIFLLICILFGGRFFIIPWFNFQIVNYFFGICFVLKIISDIVHERSIRIIDTSDKKLLAKIFLLNFALAWIEQSCIYQYLGNITLGPEPTIIEIFSSSSELQSFLIHFDYVSGIIIGSIVFTGFSIFICRKLSMFCFQLLSIPYSRWIRRLNFYLIILMIGFTFSSIPFYSFDYLVLSNLGFVSQDKSLQNTIFSSSQLPELPQSVLSDPANDTFDKKPKIDTDVTPFDKGRYLMFDINDSVEQLNYQGEYVWLTKKHRLPIITRTSTFSKFTAKLFKKMKQYSTDTSRQARLKFQKNRNKQNKTNIHETNNVKESKLDNFNETGSFESDDENFLESTNVMDSRNKSQNELEIFFENLIKRTNSQSFIEIVPSLNKKLERNFKQKYYSNPIYKLLLSADIDVFLFRQPRSFTLTPKQENELFQKRLVLANYYDSLRYYNELPYLDEFQDVFDDSKSYADRVYNQQFQGTLKIIRRLFAINLNSNNDETSPLTTNTSENLDYTEQNSNAPQEISSSIKNKAPSNPDSSMFLQYNKNDMDNLILKFDQPLYKKSNTENLVSQNFHEEFRRDGPPVALQRKGPRGINKKKNNGIAHENGISNSKFTETKPFIQLTNPIPFYVGWDEQLRKLVVTNRLSPRCFVGYSMKFPNKNYFSSYPTFNELIQKNKTIDFTTWPIAKNILENGENESSHKLEPFENSSYNVLFESIENLKNKNKNPFLFQQLRYKMGNEEGPEQENEKNSHEKLTTVPVNVAKNFTKQNGKLQDIMPKRGGFVWPGHSDLNFKIKFNFKEFDIAKMITIEKKFKIIEPKIQNN